MNPPQKKKKSMYLRNYIYSMFSMKTQGDNRGRPYDLLLN